MARFKSSSRYFSGRRRPTSTKGGKHVSRRRGSRLQYVQSDPFGHDDDSDVMVAEPPKKASGVVLKRTKSIRQVKEREARKLAYYIANYWSMMITGLVKEEYAQTKLDKSLFEEFNSLNKKKRRDKLEFLRSEVRRLEARR